MKISEFWGGVLIFGHFQCRQQTAAVLVSLLNLRPGGVWAPDILCMRFCEAQTFCIRSSPTSYKKKAIYLTIRSNKAVEMALRERL
jgi:hypothetical protein